VRVVDTGTRNIKMFVLDEADEMLSRGFKDQIYDVFRTLNENIQVRGQFNGDIVQRGHSSMGTVQWSF